MMLLMGYVGSLFRDGIVMNPSTALKKAVGICAAPSNGITGATHEDEIHMIFISVF